MRHILSPRHREVLARFAHSNVLVALDYDGTLAPIVDHPAEAGLRPETRVLLHRLSGLYPCVVISGRSRTDVLRMLRGTGVTRVVGNHGAEMGDRQQFRRNVAEWKKLLIARLAAIPGVWIEDKGLSLTVHYRQSTRKVEARRTALTAAGSLKGARLLPAKQALNVIPETAPHKGTALEALKAKLKCDTAIYVGDDITDEDVFALEQPGTLLTIRVGAKAASHARFALHCQREIDDLLRVLAEMRVHSIDP